MRQRGRVARQQLADVLLDPVEEGGVEDGAVLDHFGQAGRQLARRAASPACRIGQHRARLVEGADHVLAQRVVDAGLAADRGIDLRQQRGRHLHEGHAAHVAGGGEAGHVADHAAAQRDQRGLAVAFVGQQGVEDQVQRLPVLVLFAVGQHDLDHVAAGRAQRRGDAFEVQRRDGGVGDDGDLAAAMWRAEQRRVASRPGPMGIG